MFTPIRNLITYIQKNASGSNFFGGTTPTSPELSETVVHNNNNNSTSMESEIIESIVPTMVVSESEPSSSLSSSLLKEPNLNENNNHPVENELLLKEKSFFVSTNATTVNVTDQDPDPLNENPDYNDNDYLEEVDDETGGGGEEEKDIFLDFPPENETETETENDLGFPRSEVIVLNDPDLNVSMNSEPTADPLAIDEYNVNLSVSSPNPLDSSTEGDVLFVVDIESVVGQAPRLIDEAEDSTQLTTTVKSTDEQELRSDGSDSGLGSETSTLQTTATSVTDTSVGSIMCASPMAEKIPLRSNLKRHIQDVDVVDTADGQQLQNKKPRRSINFEGVKVFYFPRIQGHGCVPSQGGCTLGMGAHHISFKTFSLAEHAAELRRAHKLQLQEVNPRGSSSDESDSDEELSEGSGSDLDAETNGFLQPVSPKQRRALLKAAGIRKIDANEKIECRDIRNSREICGCVCRDFCDPDTCACSQAGIKCQVDRAMFPCGCSRDACGNVIGRIEFNPSRVRTHFIHTIMRLDMENRQQKRTDELSSQLVASSTHLVYNNVPALAASSNSISNISSTTAISTYNPIPTNYNSLDQSSNEAYHHHMHQQYNVYNNHMPQTHPASGLCGVQSVLSPLSAPPAVVMGAPTVALTLPTHNLYTNATPTAVTTEVDSIALNGGVGVGVGNLHYQDGTIYPPVVIPPVVTYGDILTPYANTAPYENPTSTYSTSNVYTSYHNAPHHQSNHVHPTEQPQPFLGYNASCNGDMADFSESHNSFISLNTPDASSARLSAINDLLHSTRNTTSALVAVSPIETAIVPCESGLQDHQLTDLPVSNVIKETVEECDQNLAHSDLSRRPETPPDEGLTQPPAPLAVIETNENQLTKEVMPEITEVGGDKIKESIPEVFANEEEPVNQRVEKEEELPITESKEMLEKSTVSACSKVEKSEIDKIMNGDIHVDLPAAKPEENGINNATTPTTACPPIVESALA
ncbi:uncharacterized protein LOC129950052 [Eupeodes corollae]|uniref:uncharacterized protein LOC129950052 n=1 Tax=Eupeodes corollae TaxID=290404 RepID=UPI0024927956|nr:uncharacterized protein LOC129950052 [Eupeodes corollae]XP_055917806.1 uncharacterized protein LOC129950052 [Eupeodes corollae]XP_055917807.1 uncharacterized protein LOC129950052 [Eupeodes corollae]XP_055917808.1 uncharacterized protein LOC129950052 [Eupeodes corollae]XP_055917809.1 uncharacterized protein LOC129950052 [Eupeodes corollae]